MGNVISYAKEQMETFEEREFCPVDSLALAFLAYLDIPDELQAARTWEGMRVADLYLAEHFPTYFRGLWAEKSGIELLSAMAASPRFRDITVHRYVEKIDQQSQMQFCATTYHLPNGLTYVAYKGTDATFVGWKEDFNLCFQYPVPSQVEALDYLAEVASRFDGPIMTGGHSKGGNLAIYAAAKCAPEVKGRIRAVFSHDGPGFLYEFMESADYLDVAGRVDKTIPQSSIIGMLMEQGECSVVKSDAHGVWQHDPATWLVEGCNFVQADELNNNAVYADSTIGQWIRSRTRDERERFIDSLYSLLENADAETMAELRQDWRNAIPTIAKAMSDMDPDTRSFAAQTLTDLVAIGAKNVPELLGVREVPNLKQLLEKRANSSS